MEKDYTVDAMAEQNQKSIIQLMYTPNPLRLSLYHPY